MTKAFFVPAGDQFQATAWTRGPWSAEHQHAGPPAALLAHQIEGIAGDKAVARFTIEILRPIPIAPLRATARMTRPGKRVAFAEATLTHDDTEVARASCWLVKPSDDPMPEAGAGQRTFPGPDECEPMPTFDQKEAEGYFTAMEWRAARGSFREPGPAAVWMRMKLPLIDGEAVSPVERVLAAADSGNGVSRTVDMRTHGFINVELSVHLIRPLRGEWVCLDAMTRADRGGIGLAETKLWDTDGVIGAGHQTLLIAPR